MDNRYDNQLQGYKRIDGNVGSYIKYLDSIPRFDGGIIEEQIVEINPVQPGDYGYQYQNEVEFRWDHPESITDLFNSKIRGKFALVTGTTACIDVGAFALVEDVQLLSFNNANVELNKNNNVFRALNKLITCPEHNLKSKWHTWEDGAYKEDDGVDGVVAHSKKRHITQTAQYFEIPLVDLLSYAEMAQIWHDFADGGGKLRLVWANEKKALSSSSSTTPKLKIIELVFVARVLRLNDKGYKYYTYDCSSATERHISEVVGLSNAQMVLCRGRISTETNSVGNDGSSKRSISKSVNPQFTSFDLKIGSVSIPRIPLKTNYDFYDMLLKTYGQDKDTDFGGLINHINYNLTSGDDDTTIDKTQEFIFAFNLY